MLKSYLDMEIIAAYPDIEFVPDEAFFYDAADEIVYYHPRQLKQDTGKVALLHEIAHAQLNHFDYSTDLELIVMEARAWSATRDLARQHAVALDEGYLKQCLASYNSWLENRASCPLCTNFSLQLNPTTYQCFRCLHQWQIDTQNQALIEITN